MDFQLIFCALAVNVLWILGFFYACKIDSEKDVHWMVREGEPNRLMTDDEKRKLGMDLFKYDLTTRQILWKIKYHSLELFGEYWSKPICTCPVCMSSLHSLWFFYFFPITWAIVPVYLLYIFCLAGINSLIVDKFDL